MTTKLPVERSLNPLSKGRVITQDDAEWIASKRSYISPELSDAAFVNLYLFQHVHGYQIHDGSLPYIRGLAYDGTELVIPFFNPKAVPNAELWEILGPAGWLYPFSQDEAERLFDEFDANWTDSDSDYIYASEQLQSFRGLKTRRQQLRQFEASHADATVIRELGAEETLRAAREVLYLWRQDVTSTGRTTDFDACMQALEHQACLGLFGLLVEVGREPAGFVLASRLSTRMAAIHFAKGQRRFAGIYPFMFRAFAQTHAYFEYINFEQDLGKPGFRQAKQSYQPIYLARKYRLRPRALGRNNF
jgi:hypothetical protein